MEFACEEAEACGSSKTTQVYIDLAGETFRDEAELLERRLWGESGTKSRYQDAEPFAVETTNEAD